MEPKNYLAEWMCTRLHWFVRCVDTGKLMWPLQKAYWGHVTAMSSNVNKEGYGTVTISTKKVWICPAAMTFRKLRGESERTVD